MNKKIPLLVMLASFLLPFVVCANVEITEIMYDLTNPEGDSDREWVELQNTGTSEVDLSKWNFYDTSHHSFHPVGASALPAGGYAVIVQDVAKFKVDWPNFSGLLFSASFPSLGNEGDTLKLKNNSDKTGPVADQVTYASSMGASGDGNSLQKVNGNFAGASPTPGAQNSGQAVQNSTATSTSTFSTANTSATTSAVAPKPKEVVVPKITAEIIMKENGIAQIPFLVSATILGYSKEPLYKGRALWNFGDGTTRDKILPEENFYHAYKYPGEYVLTLSYYENFYQKDPTISDRLVVSVFAPSLVISSVGPESDPYVELENKSDREVELSLWMLKGAVHEFIIPAGTVLLSKKKLVLDPAITGFAFEDLSNIRLLRAGGSLVASYPKEQQEVLPVKIDSAVSVSLSPKISYNAQASFTPKKEVIDLSELSQTASAKSPGIGSTNSLFLALGAIIVIGVSAVFLIRKKPKKEESGMDENIDSQELTVGNIRILE